MGKILIIAEKPSVATDLSRTLAAPLGKFEKKGKDRNTYFENDLAVITSAVGHLIELRMPTGPNGKKLPWNFKVLPAIPKTFELEPKEKTESRLKLILRLARRKDVTSLVNACDAGREGELIFQYIIEYGNISKPSQRLWMQSMTRGSILDAWSKLRNSEAMHNLSDAAKCRSESDWLVGLNATRALTCFRSRHGGFNITAAGRVQTPTLAILAKREAEIRAFKSAPYFEVAATFDVAAGDYEGKWVDETWKKDPANPHSRAERIWDAAQAETIKNRCEGKQGIVHENKKATSQIAPQLYDLTTLQREAPFSAKQTLSIAQALYERHKMITYPRTDSRYLPEDYFDTVRETIGIISRDGGSVAPFANAILSEKATGPRLHKSKRVFDSKKVSDHFAIIPTGKFVKLSDAEQKVFDFIVKRFLAVFYPVAEFEITKRLTKITSDNSITDTFRTNGKILVKPGWLAVYGRHPGSKSSKEDLVPVADGESAQTTAIAVRNEETKPPARYNESTLLSAMEGAGKLLDDEALAAAMAERGLGTPATRAAIIEGLLSQKYIARDGAGGRAPLHVTTRGMRLIEILKEMGTKGLTSPTLTGDWEYKLRQMEQGLLKRSDFMHEIEEYTRDIVARADRHMHYLANKDFPDLNAPCPKCGAATLKQTDVMYKCKVPDCGFQTKSHIASRILAEEEAKTLFSTGYVGPLDGFKSRFNKPFEAGLKLDEKFKIQFVFDRDEDEKVELNDETLLEKITLADGSTVNIHQTEKAYFIPEVKTKSNPEGARIGRIILQKELEPTQVIKMIKTGKSDLIPGFISRKTKRPFSAFLKWDNGKIGFEFEPRKPKAAAKKR